METIREILRLFHEERLSCRQMAAILSVSASTVSRVLRRAEAAGLGWPLAENLDSAALFASVYPARDRAVGCAAAEQPNWAQILSDLEEPREAHCSRMTRKRLWEKYRDGVRARGRGAQSFSVLPSVEGAPCGRF